jgi:hypothetical protein
MLTQLLSARTKVFAIDRLESANALRTMMASLASEQSAPMAAMTQAFASLKNNLRWMLVARTRPLGMLRNTLDAFVTLVVVVPIARWWNAHLELMS